MPAREIILYGRSFNTLPSLILSDTFILDRIHKLLTVAETFEMDYGVSVLDARTRIIANDLRGSNFLSSTGHATCTRHVCVAKFVFRCPSARSFVENSSTHVAGMFSLTRLRNSTLLTTRESEAVPLLETAERYLGNQFRLKGDFSTRAFYAALKRYIPALSGLYSNVLFTTWAKF